MLERTLLSVAGLLLLSAGAANAADENSMLTACRAYAASHLRVSASMLDLKYEGQRTDGTHAVNGAVGPSQRETFQCSFRRDGRKISHFVFNNPTGCPADVSQADRYKYPDCG